MQSLSWRGTIVAPLSGRYPIDDRVVDTEALGDRALALAAVIDSNRATAGAAIGEQREKKTMGVGMSETEVATFLGESTTATIISLNPDGLPLPTPVWFTNDGATLYFRTMRKTQKAKNLVRDPRVVVQVEAGTSYFELRAVIVTGLAREATEDEAERFQAGRNAKYGPSTNNTSRMTEATQRHYDNPLVVFRVDAEKVRSWDNRKLRKA